MKIFFTASIAGKEQYKKNYYTIIDILKLKGHEIVADHILKTAPYDIKNETPEQLVNFHKKMEKQINECDCVVAETSYPSISVGYQISIALQRFKPVLILYSVGDPPSLFVHSRDGNIVIEQYTMLELHDILPSFIDYVSGIHSLRFTFFITPSIATHLEKKSKEHNLPKSAYLRSLIEEDIRNS